MILKPRPESGLDCITCAMFSRQRYTLEPDRRIERGILLRNLSAITYENCLDLKHSGAEIYCTV